MIYKSHLPDIPIPDIDIYSFLIQDNEHNTKPGAENTVVTIDGPTGRTLTHGQVKDISSRLAAGWIDHLGMKKGDTVAVFAPNQYDHVILYFSLMATGCTITPGNPGYTEDEFQHQLSNSGAQTLITVPELLPVLLKVCDKIGLSRERIFLFGDKQVNGCKPFYSLLPNDPQRRVVAPLQGINPSEDVPFICYSSGTTGVAKGVCITHRNFVGQVLVNLNFDPDNNSRDDDRLVAFLPFYHIYGLTGMVMNSFYRVIPVVVMQRFDLELFCQLVERYKITFANIVPPIAVLLAKSPIVKKYNMSSLVRLGSGAAPLGDEHINALVRAVPSTVRQGYGMTETTSGIILQRAGQSASGSIGVLVSNNEAKIVDENDNELGHDLPGELLVRGVSIMKGYLNNEEANAKTFTKDGWMRTGDVAVFSSKTKEFYIVDRIKELIKYKGLQVAPAELEAILLGNEKVADCAVVGVYNSKEATEYPRAYVVLQPGNKDTPNLAKELSDYVAAKVANHKKLRGGIRFVQAIPKSPSGKILRKDIRLWIKNEEQQAQQKAARL
ncbi:uncharacterized protein BX664DRAFT_336027 [Halteromyces radiatus]|uniref:uncharacterized protein n=1 Tax=Halteromyces radiatus TaxID=101107 RepID=UPI00221F31FD|nr:uncharacterized protein BX664DRAFT_336027 [Halteromyces radiatus]KAI8086520.1 hypothetical protein BX664DRAFT_336027 [Halteromyces radiatus]